jgi:hypothetical protein
MYELCELSPELDSQTSQAMLRNEDLSSEALAVPWIISCSEDCARL